VSYDAQGYASVVERMDARERPFTWGDPTLSSALSSFTSEFEMGSGGTHTLRNPGQIIVTVNIIENRDLARAFQ